MTRRFLSKVALCSILLTVLMACGDGEARGSARLGHHHRRAQRRPDRPPEGAQPTSDTAADAAGAPVSVRQYAATAAEGSVEVGFTVLDTEGGSYDLDMGVREVATSLHGQVVSARPTDIDGHAALDVEVSSRRQRRPLPARRCRRPRAAATGRRSGVATRRDGEDLRTAHRVPRRLMIGAETGELHVYAVPLRRRFRGIDVRQGVLIHGQAGWGEFSPFAEYDDAEAAAWWRAAEEAAGIGWPPPFATRSRSTRRCPVPAAEVAAVMAAFPGCGTAKVKIAEPGQTAADDQARLEAVRAVLGSAGHIRVDANGGWDLDLAARFLPLYDRAAGGLEYAEQPCATVEDMAALRRRVDIPIAADESIRRSDDPIRLPGSARPTWRCSRSSPWVG